MSKRISALLLALALVLSVTLCVSAAESAGLGLTAQRHGDEVVVTVNLADAQGVTNGKVAVTYDPETAALTDAQALVACGAASVNQTTAGTVSLAWVGSTLEAENDLMELTFQVKAVDVSFEAAAVELYMGEQKVEAAGASVTVGYNPFVDIDNHWAKGEILRAYHLDLFQGVTETTFVPEGTMDRAMFVTVLHRMAGTPEAQMAAAFTDVDAGRYYTDAVAWAVEAGVTNGVSQTQFAPHKAIGRQEMVTMLYRFAESMGKDVSAASDLSAFADGQKVSGWARDALSWAVAEGILQGYPGGLLLPQANAARGQAAVILCRYLDC